MHWLVEEGAKVKKGDPILEIDTDKISFEIEAPADGAIRAIRGRGRDPPRSHPRPRHRTRRGDPRTGSPRECRRRAGGGCAAEVPQSQPAPADSETAARSVLTRGSKGNRGTPASYRGISRSG